MIPNNPPKLPDYLEKIKSYPGLSLDDLGRDNLQFFQVDDSFKFGNEQVLLAHFASNLVKVSTKKRLESSLEEFRIIDPGAGSGILTVLSSALIPNSCGLALELMERPFELLQANLQLNNLLGRFTPVQVDIREVLRSGYPESWEMGRFSLAICNPPYFELGSGPLRPSNTLGEREIAVAREEIQLNLNEYIKFTSDALKYGGIMAIINRPERLLDTIKFAEAHNLHPYILRQVKSSVLAKPKVFLMACSKAKARKFSWQEDLIIYQENGEYTTEVENYYNS